VIKTQNLNHHGRKWNLIEIAINYGYFSDFPSARITCYSDGMLVFKTEGAAAFFHEISSLNDREHSITRKSLVKLDHIIEKLSSMEKLDLVGEMCDGPSFECLMYLSTGVVRGFHYCSAMPVDEIQELEDELRKVLREEFFLRKHKKERG
jgi:hypothetical protein